MWFVLAIARDLSSICVAVREMPPHPIPIRLEPQAGDAKPRGRGMSTRGRIAPLVEYFCINLARRPDRRARAAVQLSQHAPHTQFRFVDGVDGVALTSAELTASAELRPHTPPYIAAPALDKMLRKEGTHTLAARPDGKWDFSRRLLTRGAVGCALSHLGLWERRAQADDPHAISVVLEDDAHLCDGFDRRMDGLLAALRSGSLSGGGGEPAWDLCYLGHFPRPPGAGKVLGPPAADGLRHIVGRGVYGLFGYVLSRRGARALLKWRHRGRSSTAILPLSSQVDCALAGCTATTTLVAAVPPLAFCGLEQCLADSDVQLCI